MSVGKNIIYLLLIQFWVMVHKN